MKKGKYKSFNCSGCRMRKSVKEFSLATQNKRGHISICKNCVVKRVAEWRKRHPEARKKEYQRNKVKIIRGATKWAKEHKEHRIRYMQNYFNINREKIQKKKREYERRKERTDIQFKLGMRLRARLRNALKNLAKVGSAVRDLGCTIEYFKQYLESKFYSGMTWDNYGTYWVIDHIKELWTFNLAKREQFLEAVNYKNLQPLTIEDHQIKTIKNRKLRAKLKRQSKNK